MREKNREMEVKSQTCVNHAVSEGFELLGFKFEIEDTAFSMATTAGFMVLFYFGMYIRHCDNYNGTINAE